mmetsp:Transcript_4939/g.15233  ORF Transcript_4939/g.15233 Transcript_4939/m.15233 type:complete len:226 (+) Transcript_4939:563-1240(+)
MLSHKNALRLQVPVSNALFVTVGHTGADLPEGHLPALQRQPPALRGDRSLQVRRHGPGQAAGELGVDDALHADDVGVLQAAEQPTLVPHGGALRVVAVPPLLLPRRLGGLRGARGAAAGGLLQHLLGRGRQLALAGGALAGGRRAHRGRGRGAVEGGRGAHRRGAHGAAERVAVGPARCCRCLGPGPPLELLHGHGQHGGQVVLCRRLHDDIIGRRACQHARGAD